jgi:hypothetical protein
VTEASVTVDSVRDDALSAAVAGEIDLSNAPTVERQILEAIPNHLAEVTVALFAWATSTPQASACCSLSEHG